MDDTRQPDLEDLLHLHHQVLALSDAMRVRFEPIAQRLAGQGHHDAGWLRDELHTCRTAPDSGTLATVGQALEAVLRAGKMASRPIPLDLLRLRNAAAAFLSVTQGCQLTVEAFAQAGPADEGSEPAGELVAEVAAALDPDRTGSPAALMVAMRGVLAER